MAQTKTFCQALLTCQTKSYSIRFLHQLNPMAETTNKEIEEIGKKLGFLLVITGGTGVGKDSLMDRLMNQDTIKEIGIRKIVTCTDRPPRTNTNPPEIPGISYHFVSPKELDLMEKEGNLAEPITTTGLSRKATPVSEIKRLYKGENLVWRIDPSRASEIASGKFFERLFPKHAAILNEHTLVLCVTAPQEVIEQRRKARDKEKYNREEYTLRDSQEHEHLEVLFENAVTLENAEGKLEETVNEAVRIILTKFNSLL